ncbi:MAG: sensor histidine kinase [Rudaea sp.]|nr:sensor histidine kinase [Rudaea sp.]
MKPLRPQLRGLIFKLALFYVLLSLPSLILVESAILIFEFNGFMQGVEAGSLTHAAARAANDLAADWPNVPQDEERGLATWTEAWILRLQRPDGGLVEKESYILVELAADPLAAAVLAPDGRVIAQTPHEPRWQMELPGANAPEFALASASGLPQRLPGAESPYRIRRVLTPVRASDGSLRGFLFVELRLPVPWHRFLLDLSLEWPVVLGYLIVFGIASSFFLAAWVTRRLNRVARAAAAWSRGDFSDRIQDHSRDELGRLSGLLDGMALELKALMRSRAQLATLAERQRLARDLHDTVKQKAFALNMQLATARRQLNAHPVAANVAQAERLSQQIQQELVQILDELRASDAELPLTERLRRRSLEWAQVSGVILDLDIVEVQPLPAEMEEAVLRIADEALANVLRHSGADHVALTLRLDGDRLYLIIADNGLGTSGAAPSGMGLANMRERAQALPKGTFDLDSGAGQGTRVRISFSITGTTTA